ncbi:MAG: hypothetical protein K2M55_00260 [Muribaculaceae bacterium]|nr:hypothetical protein [Muribaculaceae bacterium]
MKAIYAILLAIFTAPVYAQTEISSFPLEVDSIGIENSIITDSNISGDLSPLPTLSAPRLPLSSYPNIHYRKLYKDSILQIPSLSFIPGLSNLYSWRNGSIIATGEESDMLGLMHMDNGTIGIFQSYENMSLYLGLEANKYGFYQGLHTQYGISGNLSYYLSPHLSFTAYGTYYFGVPPTLKGGLPMSPAMMEYCQRSTLGGYMNYRINDRYGILVGGQAVQQMGTNKYQFEPVVTPYFKVGKVEIGLPVGQILNGIIREQNERMRNIKRSQAPHPKR